MGNLKLLSKIKKLKRRPKVEIKYVVCAQNIAEIKDLVSICKDFDIDRITFTPMFAVPGMEDILPKAKMLCNLDKILEASAIPFKDYALKRTNIFRLTGLLKSDMSGKDSLPFVCENAVIYNYDEMKFWKGFQCYIPWYCMIINLKGDVYSCCNYDKLNGGNIYKDSLRNIWYGEKFSNVRKKMKYDIDIKKKKWKLCHNCVKLEFLKRVKNDISKIKF